MIDLDAIEEWSPADELYCQFGAHYLLGRILTKDWMKFCHNYCHYRYILPDDRIFNSTLLDTVYARIDKTYAELSRLALLPDQIEVYFTEREQSRIAEIISRRLQNG